MNVYRGDQINQTVCLTLGYRSRFPKQTESSVLFFFSWLLRLIKTKQKVLSFFSLFFFFLQLIVTTLITFTQTIANVENRMVRYLNVCKHELYLAIFIQVFYCECDKKIAISMCRKDRRTDADSNTRTAPKFSQIIFLFVVYFVSDLVHPLLLFRLLLLLVTAKKITIFLKFCLWCFFFLLFSLLYFPRCCVFFRATVPRANHVMVCILSVCDSIARLWGSEQWYFLPPR